MMRRTVKIGVVVGLVALMIGGLSVAQPPGGAGGMQGGGGMFNRMRQMAMDGLKQQLNVKDDAEWKVIQPRLQRVLELNMQTMGRQGNMMRLLGFGGRGGPGGPGGGPGGPGGAQGGPGGGQGSMTRGSGPNGEMTDLDKAQAQLHTLVTTPSPSPEEVKKALTAVREAVLKMQQERTAAQLELKKILTPLQEAVLVDLGQLD